MGSRAGLEGCVKSRPHRDSIPDRSASSQSLYRLSYVYKTDLALWSRLPLEKANSFLRYKIYKTYMLIIYIYKMLKIKINSNKIACSGQTEINLLATACMCRK